MRSWVKALDRVLRGEATQVSALRQGVIDVPAGGLAVVLVLLGMVYGFCMGWFALFNREAPEYRQLVATMLKVPALFFLTLLVTFPSLYVFNALVGSRLTLPAMLRLLLAALGVILAVLASFGPITAFFSVTTTSYPFIGLLNVLIFSLSGFLGLAFLLRTLHRLSVARSEPPEVVPAEPAAAAPAGALDRLEGRAPGREVKYVFYCWVVVFALVGAQMSWVLRPFIGDPTLPFAWFRQRQSNFFEAVARALADLFR
jgi:hypothetical protein